MKKQQKETEYQLNVQDKRNHRLIGYVKCTASNSDEAMKVFESMPEYRALIGDNIESYRLTLFDNDPFGLKRKRAA